MLQEILSQELTLLEPEFIECDELDEVMAGGVGCEGSGCAGECAGKHPIAKG